jgi:diacylglycerol kinase family enzyme
MGFDAVVLRKSNQDKEKGKTSSVVYYRNILTTLFKHKSLPCTISIDNKSFEADVFSLNAGLCKYSGGGMMQVPNAVFNDGLIDVTIIERIKKFKVIRNIKKLYDGSFINLKEVQTHKTKCLHVESKHNILLEADGEFLGNAPAKFSIVPSALSIISNLK